MGIITSYIPHTEMNQILLHGREHPLPPQDSIVLLHRSSTIPLHYDATQPATRINRPPSATRISRHPSVVVSRQLPKALKITTKKNDTQDHSTLTELQPPRTTQLSDEPTIPLDSQLTHQELPLNTLIIPDDLKSPPTNEVINLDESPHEEIDEIRPLSPTCSSTDEYDEFPDATPEQPAIQSQDDSSDESDQEYERPPLDWSDMDPAQRLTWFREHQLPNQKPSKLMLTDSQDLTRRQIGRLKKSKGPKSFHAQSSKAQFNSKQNKTDFQSPFPALTTTPTQIPQPNLPFPEKRSYQDQHNDQKETKKRKFESTPDEPATNDDPPLQSPTPFIDDITTFDPSQAENDPDEQLLTNKRKLLDQQHEINEDSQESKKQRLPHDPETQITFEFPTTHPFIPISTTIPEGISTQMSPY